MTRLIIALVIAAVLVPAALLTATESKAKSSVDRPPNIIFILADDLGIGHLGCYGQTKIKTPHIDRLAVEGMKFTNFYAGANVCAPARSTLMTGLHTGHTAVRNNGLDRHLYDEDVTVAEVLKKVGYVTGGYGKWGLGRPHTPGVAVKQGFDEWVGQYSQTHAHFFYPYYVMHNLDKLPLPENEGLKKGVYVQDVIHRKSLEFIERSAKSGRPFFAYLPNILPHVELTAPESSWTQYKGQWPVIKRADPRPGYLGSDDAIAEFAGMVHHLDMQVGEIMALLKKLNIDDNTIVFFTSDNGPQPGAWKDIFVEFFDGAAGRRGAKGDFYEGGIRTPMLVRWPGRIKPGSTSDFIGYFPDIMPTLAELAGASSHMPAVDGISIVPTLLGNAAQKTHDYLYWEQPGPNQTTNSQAIRMGDFKAHRPGPKAKWELYNLASDPAEKTNIADQHPDVMKRFLAIAASERTPERSYPPGDKETAADFKR